MGNSTDQREQILALVQTQCESIIARNLSLTTAEAEKFWPVYRRYRAERDEVDNRSTKLLAEFGRALPEVPDREARKLVSDFLDIQKADLAIKTKYVRLFEKAVSSRKVAQFYQFENKLDVVILYDRAQVIPLIR